MSQPVASVNTKLIDSLAQIILSLSREERNLLTHKIRQPKQLPDDQPASVEDKGPDYLDLLTVIEQYKEQPIQLPYYKTVDHWDSALVALEKSQTRYADKSFSDSAYLIREDRER